MWYRPDPLLTWARRIGLNSYKSSGYGRSHTTAARLQGWRSRRVRSPGAARVRRDEDARPRPPAADGTRTDARHDGPRPRGLPEAGSPAGVGPEGSRAPARRLRLRDAPGRDLPTHALAPPPSAAAAWFPKSSTRTRSRCSSRRPGCWISTTSSRPSGSATSGSRRVIECRFFAGLSEQETAEALGVSVRTAQRDWMRARALDPRGAGGRLEARQDRDAEVSFSDKERFDRADRLFDDALSVPPGDPRRLAR